LLQGNLKDAEEDVHAGNTVPLTVETPRRGVSTRKNVG